MYLGLAASAQEKCASVGASPEEASKNTRGLEPSEEEKAPGRPHCSLSVFERTL